MSKNTLWIRISLYIRHAWMVSKGFSRPFKFKYLWNTLEGPSQTIPGASLHGLGRSSETIRKYLNCVRWSRKPFRDHANGMATGGGGGSGYGQKISQFHAFFLNFGKTVCWRPFLREILDPPLHVTYANQVQRRGCPRESVAHPAKSGPVSWSPGIQSSQQIQLSWT